VTDRFNNQRTAIIIGIGLALILVTVFVFAFLRKSMVTENAYQTEVIERGNLSTVVGATGTVRAYQSANLMWQTSGTVEVVHTKLGDKVQAGELLGTLEGDSLPQNVILAEANLVSAQDALDDLLGSATTEKANAAIVLRDAQDAYEDAVNYREQLNHLVEYDVFTGFKRIETPMGHFKIPNIKHIEYYPNDEQKMEADQDTALRKAELEDAQRTYDGLQNGPNQQDVLAAEARIAAAQAVLDQANITAPFDGIIMNTSVQPGDRISVGEVAFQVENLSSLIIDLEVSEIDINSVAVGQVVTVNFDAIQEKDYQGMVIEVAGAGKTSAGSVNFRVTVELTDVDELIKPGMTAAVLIQVRNVENALLVPNRAIRALDGQRVVYILKDDASLAPVEVRLGAISDTHSEVVGGGLQAGDQVILNPPATVNVSPNLN